MTSNSRQALSQENNGSTPQKQSIASPVIESVRQTRYKVARRYGRGTIAEHEYFYIRAQDILVRSDIFNAYRKEGFQRFLSANAAVTPD